MELEGRWQAHPAVALLAQLVEGDAPAITTMVDIKGNPIAWLYSQRRREVTSDQIANTMKLAIVSIEDKRFAEHNGVDWKGTLTGVAAATVAAEAPSSRRMVKKGQPWRSRP